MGASGVTLDKLIDAKSVGVDYIEVSINLQASQTNVNFTAGDEAMKTLIASIKKSADDAGIKVWSVHMPYGANIDLSLTNDAARKKVVAFHKKAIGMVAVLQPEYILFHPSYYLGLNERQSRINSLVKSVKEIKSSVDSIGAHIVIENMLGPEILKDATHERPLCRTVEETLSIMSMMDDDVYSIVDLNHIKNPEKLILALGSRLKSLHVSDGNGEAECHYMPCEGLGTVDWTAVLSALNKVDYQGPFLYETSAYHDLTDLQECYYTLYKNYCNKPAYATATFTRSDKGWTYEQNFDSLLATNNTVEPKYHTFEGGKTITGWYACSSQNATNSYKSDNGSYFYGTSIFSYGYMSSQFGGTADTDRAMGGLCSTNGYANFGIILRNNTGAPIKGLNVTYTGETWKQGTEYNKNTGGLFFSFRKNPFYYTSISPEGGIPVEALNFIPPCAGTADNIGLNVIRPMDGNTDANRTIKTGRLTNIDLGCDETILLRWGQNVVTSTPLTTQWGLAIDDLTITIEDASDIDTEKSSKKLVAYQTGKSVWVKGTPGEFLEVYNLTGQLTKRVLLNGEYMEISGLQKGYLYLLKTCSERMKIIF